MNRLTVISKNINKREINMVVVHSFADAHKEALDAMERGCDEAVVEDEVHNVVLRLIKPKKTNFDRITESPEKLAEFLWDYTHDVITDWNHVNDPMFRHMPLKNVLGDNCTKKESWVAWLNEERKE